jgi:hypothetical protein
VQPLYNDQEGVQDILYEVKKKGKLHFMVQWKPRYIREKHVKMYTEKTPYKPQGEPKPIAFLHPLMIPLITQQYHMGNTPEQRQKWRKVEWEPKLEAASAINQDEGVKELISRMTLRHKQAPPVRTNPPRSDDNLSNREQQGIWADLNSRCAHPLLRNPLAPTFTSTLSTASIWIVTSFPLGRTSSPPVHKSAYLQHRV